MTHLYRALSWTVDEPERPREYVIHDDGVILAKVNRVAVARPDDAAMPYANPHASYDETRIVVCATAPDGTPYFYVDRTPGTTGPTPAFIVAPNGGLIGAIAVRRVGLKGMFRLLSGQAGAASSSRTRAASRSQPRPVAPGTTRRAPSPMRTARRSRGTRPRCHRCTTSHRDAATRCASTTSPLSRRTPSCWPS